MITVGIGAFQGFLDPVEAYNFHHFILIQCTMDTLVNLDESGNISSEIAKQWKISKDRKEYHFELNEGYKFQDGTKVTAKDVAYSLSRHLWKGSNSLVKIYLEPIVGYRELKKGELLEGVEVQSETKFSIKLSYPSPSFLYVLSMPSFSVLSHQAQQKGEIIGSGRMYISKKDSNLFLETWAQYQGTKPKLEHIKLIEYKDAKEIAMKVENGEVDLAIGLPTDVAESIKSKKVIKDTVKTLTYSHLFYNTKRPVFKDIKFREDLTLLLQTYAKKTASQTKFLEFLPTYFPKGVMPKEYYQKSSTELNAKEFAKRWNNHLDKNPLKLLLVKNVYPRIFLENMEKDFLKYGVLIKVRSIDFNEYNDSLKNKDYDVISGLYMGNFPDPDGFIEPIIQGQDYSFGVMPIEKELEEIRAINLISDRYERLKRYSDIFSKIESQFYFAPLFRDKIPLIYNEKLNITKSAYRYESELWKIFWKK